MSTIKATNVQHPSSGSANVTLDSSGDVTANGVLKAASLQHPSSASANITLNADGTVANVAGMGKILQVVSTTKTDTFSTTSTSMTDVTGLSAAITPSSATNKVLVTVDLSWVYYVTSGGAYRGFWDVLRDSTSLVVPTSPGSRTPAAQSYNVGGLNQGATIMSRSSFVYLDSPATTSSTTYKVQAMCLTAGTFYVNRSSQDTDTANFVRSISSITVAEVAA